MKPTTTITGPARRHRPATHQQPGPDPSTGGQAGAFWAWVGAHGGAGVTTLAQAIPGGVDLGRRLPHQDGLSGLPSVVVCRSDARGLRAARDTAATTAAAPVLGLVVVADIPERKRPKALADSLYLTRGAFPTVWEIPWVPKWRLGEPPNPANCPRHVRDLLRDLWTAVDLPLPGGPK